MNNTVVTDLDILKAVLMLRRIGNKANSKEDQIAEQKQFIEEDPNYADRFFGWIDSMRKDLAKSPEQLQREHDEWFAEFLENEAKWDYEQSRIYADSPRDEWDDRWDDIAREVGAIRF